MAHDELLAKIDQIIAFEAPRPIKENIWEIGGYLSALALRAVVELHKPGEVQGTCKACEFHESFSCPTIKVIERELA